MACALTSTVTFVDSLLASDWSFSISLGTVLAALLSVTNTDKLSLLFENYPEEKATARVKELCDWTEVLPLSTERSSNILLDQSQVNSKPGGLITVMDPIGAAASIITLLEVAYRLCDYISDLKEGGKERMKLLREVTSLCCTLDTLKEKLDESQLTRDDSSIKVLTIAGGPVSQCTEAVLELTNKLKPSHNKAGRLAQHLKWSFSKEEVFQAVEQLHRIQATITNALQQALLSVTEKIYNQGIATRRLVEEQKVKQIRDWLSPLNFAAQQLAICDSSCPGTGSAVLSSKQFELFKQSKRSIMWCPGPPGAGKTHLASIIVHDLQAEKENENDLNKTFVVYCRYDDPECQNITNILGDLLNQCLSGRTLSDDLLDLHRRHSLSQTRPPYEDFLEVLADEIKYFRKCRFVIDALDEFGEPNDQMKLLQVLGSLKPTDVASPYENVFSLLVLSRPFADIEVAIKRTWLASSNPGPSPESCNYNIYEVSADEGDIRRYLHWRIDNDYALKELVRKRPGLQEEVLTSIVRGADSMFLMAKLAADTIATSLTVKELKSSLQQIPTELHVAYDATAQRIYRQGEGRCLRAFKVMQWVMFAQRPLKSAEMEHAVSIEPNTTDIDFDDIVPADTLASLCAGLVVIDQEKRFRFAHQTVPDYLQSKFPEQFPQRDEGSADCCLTYIMYKTFSDGPCVDFGAFQNRLSEYPMYIYCSRYWYKHLQGKPSQEQKLLALRFFSSKAHWLSSRQATRSGQSKSEPLLPSERLWGDSVLHHAAYLNAHLFIQDLLSREPSALNQQNYLGRTPLMRAAVHGSVDFAQALLRLGADRLITDKSGYSALKLALWKREFEIAALLSADIVDPGFVYGNHHGRSEYIRGIVKSHATVAIQAQTKDGAHNTNSVVPQLPPAHDEDRRRSRSRSENNSCDSSRANSVSSSFRERLMTSSSVLPTYTESEIGRGHSWSLLNEEQADDRSSAPSGETSSVLSRDGDGHLLDSERAIDQQVEPQTLPALAYRPVEGWEASRLPLSSGE